MEWGEAVTLDINRLKNLGRFVIHCETEDQADELFRLVDDHLPDKLAGWRHGDTNWSWYKKDTCYALHLDKEDNATMQFSPIRYWVKYGYKIIPFCEIIAPNDLGEIQKDGCFDTNLLYEIGV